MTLIEFECQEYHFALPLASVRGVVLSAMPTPLPGAPGIVLGVLNIKGEVVTVVNFWQRAGLSFDRIKTAQKLMLVTVAGALLGLVVDAVHDVVEYGDRDIAAVNPAFAGADFANGVVTLQDGVRVIVDPEKFLLPDEKEQLDAALKAVCDELQ